MTFAPNPVPLWKSPQFILAVYKTEASSAAAAAAHGSSTNGHNGNGSAAFSSSSAAAAAASVSAAVALSPAELDAALHGVFIERVPTQELAYRKDLAEDSASVPFASPDLGPSAGTLAIPDLEGTRCAVPRRTD